MVEQNKPDNESMMFVKRAAALAAFLCMFSACKGDGGDKNSDDNITPNSTIGNEPPVARDDEASTPENTAVTIDVLENDSDPNGDMLSVAEVAQPANGTAIVSGDRVSYTPNTAFAGRDTFEYTVSDRRGGSATAVVTVSVVGEPNDPPVAVDDTLDVLAGETVEIAVLANDSDPNGDPLSILTFTPPTLGTVELQDDAFVYTAPARMGGADQFTYTIDDAHQGNSVARVYITVNGAPEATADFVDMLVDTTIQIDVTLNDIEPEGEALTVESITPTSNGTATLVGNLVEYTPDAGFEGFDEFDYVIADPNGLTSNGSVTIEVVAPFEGYQLSVGTSHACRVRGNGTVACWGRGGDQLGIGNFTDAPTPMQVGAATDWQSLSTGDYHTCGVRGNGTLWCWGANNNDQLGLPGQSSTNAPLQVGTDTDWNVVSAGESHTCAIKTDGSLYCVGEDRDGQLGLGGSNASTFTRVGTDFGWVRVAAGSAHTCGIRGAGSLWCWGAGRNGELGQGNNDSGSDVPLQVGTETDWDEVVVGYYHTCGIRSGALYCWGGGFTGQLGTGGTSEVVSPAQIGSETDWQHVSAGRFHTCGVRQGQLWCWGQNEHGELGTGNTTQSLVPQRAGTDSDWDEVYAGYEFSCGTKTNGDLYCWGLHGDGQLGIGRLFDTTTPQRVGTASNWSFVETSAVATCAVNAGGEMYCFGSNEDGQLATNSTTDAQTPTLALGGGDWSLLGNGPEHHCGIKSNGALFCWGRNWLGMLGDGTRDDKLVPTRITSQTYLSVDGGGQHGCAVRSDGSMWCWGRNSRDQLGLDPSIGESLVPVQVGVDLNWEMVDAGNYSTCGLKAGSIFCWGDGLGGVPVQQGTAINYTSLSMGYAEVCAIRSDNSLWCWGTAQTPAQVGTDTDWSFVSADGERHNCAIRTDGSLWCWGDNRSGELGDGTLNSRGAPGQVGFDTGWTWVTTGGGPFSGHTCGVRAGGLYCWGNNEVGQLGLGGVWYVDPQFVE